MAVAFRASASDTNNPTGNAAGVNVPGTAQANDALLACFTTNNNISNMGAITDPAGWTLVGTVEDTTLNNLSRLYRKLCVSGDIGASVDVSWAGTAQSSILSVIAYSGVHTTSWFNASASASEAGATNTTHTAPTVTTTLANAMLVEFFSDRNPTATQSMTMPAAFTTQRFNLCTTGTAKNSHAVAEKLEATTGAGKGGGTWTGTQTSASVGMWTVALAPALVPDAPTIGTATFSGAGQATVTWTAPVSDGGSPITGYTVTSSPGGITGSGGAGATTANVTGLTPGQAYTFTVVATNAIGNSAASSASNSVTIGAAGSVNDSLARNLNRAAGTTGLSETDAANVWAGVSKRSLVDALNIKAGNTNVRGLAGVLNQLAGTTNLSPSDAASRIIA